MSYTERHIMGNAISSCKDKITLVGDSKAKQKVSEWKARPNETSTDQAGNMGCHCDDASKDRYSVKGEVDDKIKENGEVKNSCEGVHIADAERKVEDDDIQENNEEKVKEKEENLTDIDSVRKPYKEKVNDEENKKRKENEEEKECNERKKSDGKENEDEVNEKKANNEEVSHEGQGNYLYDERTELTDENTEGKFNEPKLNNKEEKYEGRDDDKRSHDESTIGKLIEHLANSDLLRNTVITNTIDKVDDGNGPRTSYCTSGHDFAAPYTGHCEPHTLDSTNCQKKYFSSQDIHSGNNVPGSPALYTKVDGSEAGDCVQVK